MKNWITPLCNFAIKLKLKYLSDAFIFWIFDLRNEKNNLFLPYSVMSFIFQMNLFSHMSFSLQSRFFRFRNKIFYLNASVNTNGQFRHYSAIIFFNDDIFPLSLYCYKSICCVQVSSHKVTQRHVQGRRCSKALAKINVVGIGNLGSLWAIPLLNMPELLLLKM